MFSTGKAGPDREDLLKKAREEREGRATNRNENDAATTIQVSILAVFCVC